MSGFIVNVAMSDGQLVRGDVYLFGHLIHPGTLLFVIDPVTYDADLKQAEAQVGIARAKLDLAQKDEAREKEGLDKGATSRQSYETFVAQRKVAEADLFAAQSGVVKAKQNLDWTRVTAPIAGKVDRTYLTRGTSSPAGTTQGTVLTTIVSEDPMYAYFDVDDQTVLYYRRLIREGQVGRAARRRSGGPGRDAAQGENGLPAQGAARLRQQPDQPDAPGRCRSAGDVREPGRAAHPRPCSSAAGSRSGRRRTRCWCRTRR